MTQKRLCARIEGRVQGVGFRNFVEIQALALDLTGWVRNLYSGEVEVIAEGEEKQLSILADLLQRGPSAAYVTHTRLEWQGATGEFSTFVVRTSWISD
jgi:acylphosphatase